MTLSLQRSQSLGDNVTRQDLYNLISTCTLTGTAEGFNIEHTVEVTAMTLAPPVTSDGKTWWYDLSKELMKVPMNAVGASPCSIWLSVGPDAWQIPVINSNSYSMEKGDWCCFKQGGSFYEVELMEGYNPSTNSPRDHLEAMRSSANLRGFIGVLQDDATPGEIVPLTWYGFGYGKVTGFGDANGISTDNVKYNYPAYLGVATNVTGTAFAISDSSPEDRPNMIGGLLSHPTATGGTLSTTVCPCILDGTWNMGAAIGTNATNVNIL